MCYVLFNLRSPMSYKIHEVQSKSEHIDVLFSLLASRKYNISHKEQPSYLSHKRFVASHPYRYWFLISLLDSYIGTFYIQYNNSIGIYLDSKYYSEAIPFIIKIIKFKFKPCPALKSAIPQEFYINVPNEDRDFQDVVKLLGCKPVQISYRID